MNFGKFVKLNLKIWNQYFRKISSLINQRKMALKEGTLFFPNMALFTETDKHYILELLGATKDFCGLEVKTHKESSTLKYLYQFETKQTGPSFALGARDTGFSYLFLSRQADLDALRKRFAFSEKWLSRLNSTSGSGPVFSFKESFKSCFIDNCLLVNRSREIYRAKYVLHLRIVSKTHDKKEYLNDLSKALYKPFLHQRTVHTQELRGIHFVRNVIDESYVLSGQFTNLFLFPGLAETTIGKFLEKHPIFINRAFSCKRFLYEKEFEWIEGNPDPKEKSIKPDLMLERTDGFFDICDLKTAALDKQSITKDEHRRRRFIDDVHEGTAQLANYEDYFNYEKNRLNAESKYGVKTKNPKLILIVGNYENSRRDEIAEASRALKPNYFIIDYDTVNALFLQSFRES